MRNSGKFIFSGYDFDPDLGRGVFRYRYLDGPVFEEILNFPKIARELSDQEVRALKSAVQLLYLLCGVSYYKAFVPDMIDCEAFPLEQTTVDFIQRVYRKGLGEFAYKNNLDLTKRVNFLFEKAAKHGAFRVNVVHHNLVPVGGGKDSIVTIECLKKADEPITLFSLNGAGVTAEPIQSTIGVSGLPAIGVQRRLSPVLADINKSGAYNGHVPITAIVSATALVCAILKGFSAIVLSNEHSANAPNLIQNGLEINHQYSKSFEFEHDFADYVRSMVSPDIAYFSLLRPLSETAIASVFATLPNYRSIFRSCNTAFRQDVRARGKIWCCDCPKCRFVFLALAPFVPKHELVKIFGRNLFADEEQLQGFEELCALRSHKPFECVGDVAESRLLVHKLATIPDWSNDFVIRRLAPKIAGDGSGFNSLFEYHHENMVPERYLKFLHACL